MIDQRRLQICRVALAHIASNLGRGTIIPSSFDNGSRPLRTKATEALKEAGYVYKENPDGWYQDDTLVIPM